MISAYITKYKKSGGTLLESVESERDVDSMEQGVDTILVLAEIELIFFPLATVFWI